MVSRFQEKKKKGEKCRTNTCFKEGYFNE